jgi:putative tryptophan/tyrosine transport system substrate-binding protein
MRRRTFIAGLGAAAWPLVVRAQQSERVRRIGWLISEENDPRTQTDKNVFHEELIKLGWIEGRNIRIDIRFAEHDPKRIDDVAMELVNLSPEAIIAGGGAPLIQALQQRTQTIPIVFAGGQDPVSVDLVRNIARPEGNITGFVTVEPSTFGKWIEQLKEVAPRLARVCVIFHPETLRLSRYYDATLTSYIEPTAAKLGVDVVKASVRNSVDIVRAIDAFAMEPNGGVIVMPPPPSVANRDTILQLASEHRLPTINSFRELAAAGGLMSYGSNRGDLVRGAASYVDRLLRGAKVSELPVQFPIRYELVVNLKSAKAIGLAIPESFLLLADEVIE